VNDWVWLAKVHHGKGNFYRLRGWRREQRAWLPFGLDWRWPRSVVFGLWLRGVLAFARDQEIREARMFREPEGRWELVPFACSLLQADEYVDQLERWPAEEILRSFQSDYRMMLHMREVPDVVRPGGQAQRRGGDPARDGAAGGAGTAAAAPAPAPKVEEPENDSFTDNDGQAQAVALETASSTAALFCEEFQKAAQQQAAQQQQGSNN